MPNQFSRDFANMPVAPLKMWPGSGSIPIGKTPFGIFDDDDIFIEDAPRLAKWICNSLGYPIMDVELTDEIIYSQFEQAIIEFSSLVNEFNMREQMLSIQGVDRTIELTGKVIQNTPLPYIVEMSRLYGTEAGSGGSVDFHKGYIELEAGQQDYDLQELWADVSESSRRIEIRRIWHERPPTMARYFDPFAAGAGQGIGIQNLLGEFGWGSYAVASQYLLMPMYETLLRTQAIEFNDQIRRSQYSFDLINNHLRIFPVPRHTEQGMKLWFQYNILQDKFNAIVRGPDGDEGDNAVISDYANATYNVMPYEFINDVGRRWIWKYTLANCKIVLGGIRSKYESIPIPNSEIRLDGLTLRQEGQAEAEQLIEYLRETLEETGKHAQLTKAAENEENTNQILKRIPTRIYVR